MLVTKIDAKNLAEYLKTGAVVPAPNLGNHRWWLVNHG